MKKIVLLLLLFLCALSIHSCIDQDPNTNLKGENILKYLEVEGPMDKRLFVYTDTIYVPIYSNIYTSSRSQSTLLAATLSIRNSSFNDSLYVSTIDYYNTKGDLVRKYIKKAIVLPPMASIDYVIEKEDDLGGSGANFIIALNSGSSKIKPIIQAIMVGTDGNKGFSFQTDGYSISN